MAATRQFVVVMCCLLFAPMAWAQLSDNEMFASYCFGVLEQREVDRSAALALSCGVDDRCRQGQRTLLKNRGADLETMTRLRQYLFARQATSPSGPAMDALVAIKGNGKRDQQSCDAGRVETLAQSYVECRAICTAAGTWPEKETGACKVCTEQFEPAACKRSDRCDDTSRLPF